MPNPAFNMFVKKVPHETCKAKGYVENVFLELFREISSHPRFPLSTFQAGYHSQPSFRSLFPSSLPCLFGVSLRI